MALVPFTIWVARLPPGAAGARSAARGGLMMGLVSHGLLLHWLVPALAWVTVWAPVAFLAVVGVLAALTALFGWILHRAAHGAGAPLWLAVPVAWTAIEWLRGSLPGPFAFPWLELGVALTGYPELLGIAEIVGGRGVSFWMALVSGILASAMLGWRGAGAARRTVCSAALAAVSLGPALWGVHRARTLPTVPAARVAIVATDVPASARTDAEAWNARVAPLVEGTLARLADGRLDLIVLPEGTVMAASPAEASPELARLADLASSLGASILTGVYVAPSERAGAANLAVLVGAGEPVRQAYAKRRLVPIVEWRPGDLVGGGWVEGGDAAAGPLVLRDTTHAYGPLVCYEVIFPGAARRARLAGAELLVNVSNDAWFAASGGLGRVGAAQHAAHLVVRAVEHRMGAVRSANGGRSYIVDPTGRLRGVPDRDGSVTVVVADARTSEGRTPYTRTGDLAGPGSALAVVLIVCAGWLRRRRVRVGSTRSGASGAAP